MGGRLVVLVVAGVVAVFVGCGGDDDDSASNHNESVIEDAERSAASADEVMAALNRKLDLHHYAGVDGVFNIPGGICEIEDVHSGDELEVYKEESNELLSPNGETGVAVGTFQGTDTADCLKAVRDALDW